MKKKILFIQTGGTISMDIEQTGMAYIDPERSSQLIERLMPEIHELADIEIVNLFHLDSSEIGPNHWTLLADCIALHYEQFDGFVILHGTDTMAYTASALSFALQQLSKPVILTGSQVPLVNLRSDARRNLINAVEVATLPLYEVAICFNDKVYRGNRTTKMSIGDFDAFRSPNFPALAEIGLYIDTTFVAPRPKGPLRVYREFDPNVFVLKLFPGLMFNPTSFCISNNIRAIVIEAFGSGNLPLSGDYSLLPFIEECLENDLLLLLSSQATFDAVDTNNYENAKKAAELGVFSANDMLTEAAVTKVMHLFGRFKETALVKQHILLPIAGEVTP